MPEKYVLREAVRDVITDTVYRRQKHPFMSPPATLNPNAKLHDFVQDRLRGRALASIPFFDQRKVVGLLDRLGSGRGRSRRQRSDSDDSDEACVLQERFQLAA
jgi:asparagine synthase (glutamine-hydrolysing)